MGYILSFLGKFLNEHLNAVQALTLVGILGGQVCSILSAFYLPNCPSTTSTITTTSIATSTTSVITILSTITITTTTTATINLTIAYATMSLNG